MAKQYEYFQGKANWVKYVQPNQWGDWTLEFYPNRDSLEKIRELQAEGIKNVLKKNEDGYHINIKRPSEIEVRGKKIGMTPPVIYSGDWETPLGENQRIGNGSDVTVKCEKYGGTSPVGSKYLAIRWEALRVDNLVPYERERDSQAWEKAQTEGLDSQPPQPLF